MPENNSETASAITRTYLSEREWLALPAAERAGQPFGLRSSQTRAADSAGARQVLFSRNDPDVAAWLAALPDQERVLPFVFSSNRRDTYQSIIAQEGRDDSDNHGQILWGHDYGHCSAPGLPIGKETGSPLVVPRGGYTYSLGAFQFATADMNPIAEQLYQLSAWGAAPDCSIGFQSIVYEKLDPNDPDHTERLLHRVWKRYETSLVPVGGNRDAQLVRSVARARSIDLAPLVRWAETTLDLIAEEPHVRIPRRRLERFMRGLGRGEDTSFFFLPGERFERAVGELRPAPAATEGEESVAERGAGGDGSPALAELLAAVDARVQRLEAAERTAPREPAVAEPAPAPDVQALARAQIDEAARRVMSRLLGRVDVH